MYQITSFFFKGRGKGKEEEKEKKKVAWVAVDGGSLVWCGLVWCGVWSGVVWFFLV